MRWSIALALAAAATLTGTSRGEIIYGVTDPSISASVLVSFDSSNPNAVNTLGAITGITAGHTLRAVDFRPSNGQLYAISSSGAAAQLYTVNLSTGALSSVGSGFTITGNTSARVSMDFNPVVDAIRVVTGGGQNLRVNANTGALISLDTAIAASALISDVAYSNNVVGATQTTLFGYDFVTDNVVRIGSANGTPNSPNTGLLEVVGNSGLVAFSAAMGFDISGATGLGYVSMDENATPTTATEFYSVNLATGALTQIGSGEMPVALLDFSVAVAVPEPTTIALCGFGAVSAAGCYLRMRRKIDMPLSKAKRG